MANFLYVFRGGGMGLQKLSPQEMQQQMQKWVGWVNDLRNKGHLKAGDPLEASGKTVRGRKKAITDGPYAEAKDLVGGYLLIEAKDIEEAKYKLRKRYPDCEIMEGHEK